MSRIHQAIRRAERENRHEKNPPDLNPDLNAETSVKNRLKRKLVTDSSEVTPTKPISRSEVPVQLPAESQPLALPIPEKSKLVSILAPKSVPSEQYRALKAKLFQMRKTSATKIILVSSAAPSEGKTLTAVNLALTIAQEIDQKVLLVDGDLRRPSVHKVLGIEKADGLSDLLVGRFTQQEAVLSTEIPNFYVVPAGTVPENPAELLNGQMMRNFVTSIAEQFDWVILDSPPIVPLADAELLSSLVDGVLLVVRAYQTPTDLIVKSLQTLHGKRILGIVFNGIEKSRSPHYENYYYSYPPQKN
jgi:capsular exopolysaccharide synthesis family protein